MGTGDAGMFRVNFAARTNNPEQFKWPEGRDVQPVCRKFLLRTKLDTTAVRGGRMLSIAGVADIEQVYLLYKSLYF